MPSLPDANDEARELLSELRVVWRDVNWSALPPRSRNQLRREVEQMGKDLAHAIDVLTTLTARTRQWKTTHAYLFDEKEWRRIIARLRT